MSPRIDFSKAAPGTFQAMLDLETCLHGCGLEPKLSGLRLAIAAINAWNRILIGLRAGAGGYRPKADSARQQVASAA